jgi:PKD repeat protein
MKVLKTSPYKAGLRTWSNRYHFLGGTPADATHWHTLMDAVTAAEKLCYPADTTIVEAIGYAAGSDVPVAQKTYSLAGTYTASGTAANAPLQSTALVRYSTASRTSKNHPIYLFSYFHRALFDSSKPYQEFLIAAQKTLFSTYATAWISGFSDGTITATRAGPNGQAATGSVVEEYLTHRDFPYSSSV